MAFTRRCTAPIAAALARGDGRTARALAFENRDGQPRGHRGAGLGMVGDARFAWRGGAFGLRVAQSATREAAVADRFFELEMGEFGVPRGGRGGVVVFRFCPILERRP